MSVVDEPAILVKSSRPFAQALGAGAGLQVTPLFSSIRAAGGPDFAATANPVWSRVTADVADAGALWDLCHQRVGHGFGVAGAPAAVFAEPDLPQTWTFAPPTQLALGLATPCEQVQPADPKTPNDPADPYWFRQPAHSDFGPAQTGAGARIAHLDTGYDPPHSTRPARLRNDLERNFVDAAFPASAADRSSGIGVQYGHGTATLAILASPGYGGAPQAEVVPMRVANSVVLFSNSTIAMALDEVHRLTQSGQAPIDVVTMSMGGLASQAWAEAVNALYDLGVFVVTAAGNNYFNLPTRNIVYPARFNRVLAACGVMEDHRPYTDLGIGIMAGNYGPGHKMTTAMAAATPNLPWARINCPGTVDGHGGGTSSATPQIAAAAARWIAANRAVLDTYPERWMRVEAARKALFDSARRNPKTDRQRLGWGELQADLALGQAPAAAAAAAQALAKQGEDSASFAFLRVLTGLGLAAAPGPVQRMLELEALQLSQRAGVEAALDDWSKPPEALTAEERRRLADALASQPEASQALKAALGRAGGPTVPGTTLPDTLPAPAHRSVMDEYHLRQAMAPMVPTPVNRRLRAYAYDPVLSGRMGGWGMNEAALEVRWERLGPGPIGEYLEVVDVDPASDCAYAPVDLNDPRLIATDGLAPNDADPQFHQQMAYAVAMKTVEHFERALGRVALWAPSFNDQTRNITNATFVRRLRVYPHALREENAYYSPERSALLFGYFDARDHDTGEVLPGGTVFACLSHDIVAHETTHALLDGLHVHFREGGNPDAFAFHEAFSDIVALFQHFTVPEALRAEIGKTHGDLRNENMLAQLAFQFGQSTGRYGALRDAIGRYVDGVWTRWVPTPQDYANATEAHDRGAVLVAAVFDAFLDVYAARGADLIRLATGGTGVLPPGGIPVDLTNRLAEEAARIAGVVLQMCIRALDYCAPVDITFGDYLRALITADQDVSPVERREYRVAMVAAFRARGIYPPGVRQLSVGAMAWEPPPIPLPKLEDILTHLEDEIPSRWSLYTDREDVWRSSRLAAVQLWQDLKRKVPSAELAALGLDKRGNIAMTLGGVAGRLSDFIVHSVRPARRIDSEGQARTDLVIEVTQAWRPSGSDQPPILGGCTILFDLEEGRIRYVIRKRLGSEGFVGRQMAFRAAAVAGDLRDSYFAPLYGGREPFAALHRQS